MVKKSYVLGRIRRSSDEPEFIKHERRLKSKYPYRFQIRQSDDRFVGNFRRSRRVYVDDWSHHDGAFCYMLNQEIFCWILDNNIRVGAILVNLWDTNGIPDNQEFFDEMDTYSMASAELASVIIDCWDVLEIFPYGAIVDITNGWVTPRNRIPGILTDAVNILIDQHINEEKALMILKAYPLEYEGRVPVGDRERKLAFTRRQTVLMDYYEKVLGVSRLPGLYGREGWMWKPLVQVLEPHFVDEPEE